MADRQVLQGADFDLAIGERAADLTGAPRIATVVNGSLPAPTLRWREGDTVTMRVRNELAEPTSIHWHGLVLPANMDGVPGLSFHGIAPGETFTYRFPVRQNGTYWYHSHSAFQEQTGLYGALVIEPREPEPFAYDREHVVLLSDWTDRDPLALYRLLKRHSDYFNFQQRTLGDFTRDAKRDGFAATLAERRDWARMRMQPSDLADVQRGGVHLSHERPRPGRELDGAVQPRRARTAAIDQRLGDVDLRRAHPRPAADRRGGRRPERSSGDRRRIPHRDGRDVRRARHARGRGRVHDLRSVARSHGLRTWHARRARRAHRARAGARPHRPSVDGRHGSRRARCAATSVDHAGHAAAAAATHGAWRAFEQWDRRCIPPANGAIPVSTCRRRRPSRGSRIPASACATTAGAC